MTDVDGCSRRAKRLCARRVGNTPSAVHYVGYVEDDETPASIAKKFEELERIQAASRLALSGTPAQHAGHAIGKPDERPPAIAAAVGDGTLTDAQLMEVFKQTSIFTVSSAAEDNESLLRHGSRAEDGALDDCGGEATLSEEDGEAWGCGGGFWSDKDDNAWMDSRGRRARDRWKGGDVLSWATHGRAVGGGKHQVRVLDRHAISHTKVPFSWGRTVHPYLPPQLLASSANTSAAPTAATTALPSCRIELPDLLTADWRAAGTRRDYQALLINPGWIRAVVGKGESDVECAAAALSRLPVPKMCPVGFVFIWAPKQHMHAVVRQLYRWGFSYVENLTWVHLCLGNQLLTAPSLYCRRSHSTLLIFRRTGVGKDIELRHQRNPDVLFDGVRSTSDGGVAVPESVFSAIETLLPSGLGRFLELWAAPAQCHPGWTHVCERRVS